MLIPTTAHRALNQYTTQLKHRSKKTKNRSVIGREAELDSIALSLGRRMKNNVIPVGELELVRQPLQKDWPQHPNKTCPRIFKIL